MMKLPTNVLDEIILETKLQVQNEDVKIKNASEKNEYKKIKNILDKELKILTLQLNNIISEMKITEEHIEKNKINKANKLVLDYHEKKKEEYLQTKIKLNNKIRIKENEKKIIMMIYKKRKKLKRVPALESFNEDEIKEIKNTFSTYDKALEKASLYTTYQKEQEEKIVMEKKSRETIDEYIVEHNRIPSIREFNKRNYKTFKYYKPVFGNSYKDYVLNHLKYEKSLFHEEKTTRKRECKSNKELLDELVKTFIEFYTNNGRYPYISELQELNLYSTTYYCNRFETSFTKLVREIAGFKDFKFIR